MAKCARCGKEAEFPINGKIIFRNSRQQLVRVRGKTQWKWVQFVDQKTEPFCSNECHSNEQMAYEG